MGDILFYLRLNLLADCVKIDVLRARLLQVFAFCHAEIMHNYEFDMWLLPTTTLKMHVHIPPDAEKRGKEKDEQNVYTNQLNENV